MNIFNQALSITPDSVFIEANNFESIQTMKELLKKPKSSEIKKHFFGVADGANLDIRKLTSSQINKHQQALSYRNRNLLKTLLKSNEEGELDSGDLKMLHQSGTLSPNSHQDVHQYLSFHEEIDFGAFSQGR